MKKTLPAFLLFLSLLTFKVSAQESVLTEINYSDLEKYISLAKQNFPRKKIFDLQQEIVKTGIPVAELGYLDAITGSYFYRPSEKSVVDPVNPYSVNGIQIGFSVSLGGLISRPFTVKRAKAEYKIAQLETIEYSKTLETLVKTRYYDYIQSLSQLKISTQNVQESKGVAESMRRKFEKSEATLDAYNQSRMGQTAANTEQIQVEITFLKAKDALEEVIGVKLSDVK